jgi:hypothetical protein
MLTLPTHPAAAAHRLAFHRDRDRGVTNGETARIQARPRDPRPRPSSRWTPIATRVLLSPALSIRDLYDTCDYGGTTEARSV